MTKKRNTAIAMASAMVATTAIPAFATGTEVKTNFVLDAAKQAELVTKVGQLLDEKYTSKYDAKTESTVENDESVYTVKVAGKAVTNKTDFKNKLTDALDGKTLATITIVDNGHERVGEEVVNNYTTLKYDLGQLSAVKRNSALSSLVGADNITEKDGKIEIKLPSGETIELGVGSEQLDFSKPLDKDGKVIDAEDLATDAGKKLVTSFETKKKVIKSTTYTVKLTKTQIKEVEVGTLFDGLFLTKEGQELVDFAKTTTTHTVAVNEIKTTTTTTEGKEETKLTALEVVVDKINASRSTEVAEGQEAIITITGEEEELQALSTILGTNGANGKETAVKLAGNERFDTAIEVSKKLREDGNASKDSVVLTSAYSLVDGLAAGPLAAQLNTSILLTGKDAAPEVTMTELSEVLNLEDTKVSELKDKTVYIIGGEGVVSEAVVAQVEALGVTVERLSGNDRHETSLAVANKLVELKDKVATTEAFVVGATGEADAMSISAYAAQTKNPIIVSGFGSAVNDKAVEFMKNKDITIIGGDAAVSEELETKLDEANKTNKVDRLEGLTRFETNATVINKFYAGKTAKDIFVAAAGNNKLVDALTAAPLAAKSNAPIVLVTEELTKDQAEVLELVNVEDDAKIFQVGGGIVNTVIAKIVKIFK